MRIDRMAYGNRWRHRHPGEKLLLCGGLLTIAYAGSPFYHGPLVLLAATVLAWRGAGIPLASLTTLWLLPMGFITMSLPGLFFTLNPAQGFALGLHPDSLHMLLHVLLRAVSAFSAVLLFALTTPVSDLGPPLRFLRLPHQMVDLIFLVYRIFFLFLETASQIHRCQQARLGYEGFGRSVRSLGQLTAALLIKSLDRGRRLEMGLESRGFNGSLTVLANPTVTSVWAVGAIVMLLALLWQMGRMWPSWR